MKTPKIIRNFLTGTTVGIGIFAGIITAIAIYPPTPDGANPGGWLENFFDLENSKTGELIVKGNINTENPTKNQHAATKEYVDALEDNSDSTSFSAIVSAGLTCISSYHDDEGPDINGMKKYTRGDVTCYEDANAGLIRSCGNIGGEIFSTGDPENPSSGTHSQACKITANSCPSGWSQYQEWANYKSGKTCIGEKIKCQLAKEYKDIEGPTNCTVPNGTFGTTKPSCSYMTNKYWYVVGATFCYYNSTTCYPDSSYIYELGCYPN